jgi:ATP-dependent Zn protease
MIKNIVNESLIYALQDGRDALRWDDLWNAKLAEEIGLKQPVKYTPREKEMVAIHEAAHAVASYSLEKGETQIQVITIQKREGTLGLVHYQEVEDRYLRMQKEVLARIQTSLAGLAAEEIWFGQATTGSSGGDLIAATRAAAAYVGMYGMGKSLSSVASVQPSMMDGDPVRMILSDPDRKREVDELLSHCRREVTALLRRKRHVLEGIRDALLEREELIGDEIEQLMAELGEREPLDIPALPAAISGNGQQGDGQVSGDGNGQRRPGEEEEAPPPPRPFEH